MPLPSFLSRSLPYLLTLLACALIYFPRLGATGLSATEGHRVLPAWEMLERQDFLLPRLFNQVYLRKPPGMPWAIALSTSLFGHTEFAARLPSALAITALALLNAYFAARWTRARATDPASAGSVPTHATEIGSARATEIGFAISVLRPSLPSLAAGLTTALTPLFWQIGRSAEIEALNTLAAAAAVLCILDLLLFHPRSAPPRLPLFLLPLAITAAALLKGPAAFPAIGAAILAPCLIARSPRPLARPALWVALAVPIIPLALIFYAMRRALQESGQEPVLQNVTEFLWSGLSLAGIGKVLVMPIVALASALPASLALLTTFSRGHRSPPPPPLALALALASLLSLALLAALGVGNPRYAIPSLGFLPALAGCAIATVTFTRARPRVLALAAGALFIAAGLYIGILEPRARASSGREPGLRLARSLTPTAELWADHIIEARPELLLYAREHAAAGSAAGAPTIRWVPNLANSPKLPPLGAYLLLRTDPASGEQQAFQDANLQSRLEPLASGAVHKFAYTLYRVR